MELVEYSLFASQNNCQYLIAVQFNSNDLNSNAQRKQKAQNAIPPRFNKLPLNLLFCRLILLVHRTGIYVSAKQIGSLSPFKMLVSLGAVGFLIVVVVVVVFA